VVSQNYVTNYRFATLDVVRGIAVCGIAYANIDGIIHSGELFGEYSRSLFLELFVSQRFFPIFSLLFGISFGLMFTKAKQQVDHPHRVMLRRISVLAVMGIVHQFFNPGEALLPYAMCGLVILMPLSFFPPQWQKIIALTGGIVLIIIGGYFGGVLLIPGLFLLGYFIAISAVLPIIEGGSPLIWALIVVFLVVSVVMVLVQRGLPVEELLGPVPSYAGLILASTYILITVALMSTAARPVLIAVFSPIGRMALSNYIGATVVFWGLKLSGWDFSPLVENYGIWPALMIVVTIMLVVQIVISSLWLRTFKRGPLEAAWRWLTWYGEPTKQKAVVMSS
jgi:hypothetical protein